MLFLNGSISFNIHGVESYVDNTGCLKKLCPWEAKKSYAGRIKKIYTCPVGHLREIVLAGFEKPHTSQAWI